jgi:2-(1,2-epoxy-1,2-dihydrophenyl)acetyl-CoA isomerase
MADLEEASNDGVVMLTLNRPERLNAFSDEMLSRLLEALDRLATDTTVGAIVLTGAGRAFCAGGDMKAAPASPPQTQEQRLEVLRRRQRLIPILRQHPKPIVAMVNGPAYGAGLGIMLACDIRVGAPSAKVGTAYARMAFSGDFGTAYSLTRVVGPDKARELLLLGETLEAHEALRLGLFQRLLADAELRDGTMELASRLARGPRLAYALMKRNLFAAETKSLDDVLELEATHQVRTAFTEDHAEAVKAFVEKREPRFTGR